MMVRALKVYYLTFHHTICQKTKKKESPGFSNNIQNIMAI